MNEEKPKEDYTIFPSFLNEQKSVKGSKFEAKPSDDELRTDPYTDTVRKSLGGDEGIDNHLLLF